MTAHVHQFLLLRSASARYLPVPGWSPPQLACMSTVSRLPYPLLPYSPPLSPCLVGYGVPAMEYSSLPQDNDLTFGLGGPSQSWTLDDVLRSDQAVVPHHSDRDGFFDTHSMLARRVQVGARTDGWYIRPGRRHTGRCHPGQQPLGQPQVCCPSSARLQRTAQPPVDEAGVVRQRVHTLVGVDVATFAGTGVSSPMSSLLFSPSSSSSLSLSSSPVSGEAAATHAGDVDESFSLSGPYHGDATDDTAVVLPPPDDTKDRLLVSASSSAPTSPMRVLSSSRRSRRLRRHRRAMKRSAVKREPFTTSDSDSSSTYTARLGTVAHGDSTSGGCLSSFFPPSSTARPARVHVVAVHTVKMEPAWWSGGVKVEPPYPTMASSVSFTSPSSRKQLEYAGAPRHHPTVTARGSYTQADPFVVSDDESDEMKTASFPLASPLDRRGVCGGTVKCELSVLDDEDEDSCGHGMPPLEADPCDHSPTLHTSRAPTGRPIKRVRSDPPAGSLADDDNDEGRIPCRHRCGCAPSKYCRAGSDRTHNGRQLLTATSLRDHEANAHLHPNCPQTGICGELFKDLRVARAGTTNGPKRARSEPARSSGGVKVEPPHSVSTSSVPSTPPSSRQLLACEAGMRTARPVKARGSHTRAGLYTVPRDGSDEAKPASPPLTSSLVRRGAGAGAVKREPSVVQVNNDDGDEDEDDNCGRDIPPLE